MLLYILPQHITLAPGEECEGYVIIYILPHRITLAPGEECEGYAIIYLATAYYPRSRRGMRGLCYGVGYAIESARPSSVCL